MRFRYTPDFRAEYAARSIPENTPVGANVGDQLSAYGGRGPLTYLLVGKDYRDFYVDIATGQIKVKDSLDHETKSSYLLTVAVHDGKDADGKPNAEVDDSIEVVITVVNVDEAGTVTLDAETPQVGSELTASVADPDGDVAGVTWTWESSANGTAWAAIGGTSSAAYTPSDTDAGKYLRATAGYADGHGSGKSAQAMTANVVEP